MSAKKKRGRPPGPPVRYLYVGLPERLDERAVRQAERLGLTITGYVRQAVAMTVERDEATDPGHKSASR